MGGSRLACAVYLVVARGARAQLFHQHESVHEFTSTDDFDWRVLHDDSTAWVITLYSQSSCIDHCRVIDSAKFCDSECRDVADEFAECAPQLFSALGVQSGAVDTEVGREIRLKVGAARLPAIVGYGGDALVTNRYTREAARPAAVFGGEFSKRAFKAWVGDVVLRRGGVRGVDWVEEVQQLVAPFALLFTERAETSALLQSFGVAFRGRLELGVTNARAGEDGVEVLDAFSAVRNDRPLPLLVGVRHGGSWESAVAFDGDVSNRGAVSAWLEVLANRTKLPFEFAQRPPDDGGPLEIATARQLTDLVLRSPAATLLASVEDGFPAEVARKLADVEGSGVLQSALVWCGSREKKLRALCKKLDGAVVAYPHGAPAAPAQMVGRAAAAAAPAVAADKRGASFGDPAAAFDSAAASVSAAGIAVLRADDDVDGALLAALERSGAPAVGFVVFSKHADVVLPVRALCAALPGVPFFQYVVTGAAADDELLKRFSVPRAPSFVAFHRQAGAGAATATAKVPGAAVRVVAYDRARLGPPTFRALFRFAAALLEQNAPAHLHALQAHQRRGAGAASGGAGAVNDEL
ncbi:hypothetical protein M885DRAFT_570359 [Pelagophyceae sp. CCMP2097]|nr:hypothetical protein M885DRAFT_570359 [Pelagophyceae sp. CCMP2097]